MDSVDFGQRGRTLLLSTASNLDFGQRGLCHGVDFLSRNEWQQLFGKWATEPYHYSVFLLFHFPFEENHQIKITANPENVDLRLSIRPPPRLGGLAVACSLLVDPGRRLCAIFLTSHSSATRHQWLNLVSTRHECFTSDVGLTRTRLVSCILLTSLYISFFLCF